jgi:hypothetical protein
MSVETLRYVRAMTHELAWMAEQDGAWIIGCILRIAERAADELLGPDVIPGSKRVSPRAAKS